MVTEQVEQETPEVILEETPAQEDVGAIQSELEQMRVELTQTKKGLSTAHQTLTERDKELKRRADLESRIDGLHDTLEILATAIISGREDEGLDPTKRQDILTDLHKKRSEQEAKQKQKELSDNQLEYSQKADALYARAKEVFADDDDNIERIEDLLMNGRFERAETRVVKAEQKKVPGKESKMETDEQRIDRLAEEKLQKHLEERGLLETHSASPSGSGGSVMEATRQYANGEITAEEARKRGVKF